MKAPTKGAADVGTPTAQELNAERHRLEILERMTREFYLDAAANGVTHEQMGKATGLPDSLFSMWLRRTRSLKKLEVLQTLVEAAPRIERAKVLT